jgi:hypothetical protein
MKKKMLTAGRALKKSEQKTILGGEQVPGGDCSQYPNYPNFSPGGYTSTSCTSDKHCPPNPTGGPVMCDFGCCLYAY